MRTKCPSRLASLGGVGDLQADFEEEQAMAASGYKLKQASVLVSRSKQQAASDKAFRLRGFKGKRSTNKGKVGVDGVRSSVSLMSKKDWEAFQVQKARKARMAGERPTEVHSRKERANMVEFGGASFSKKPVQPWQRTVKITKVGSSVKAVRLNLFSVVALFKRTGKLPIYSAESIKKLPSDGVDGKALRRMIEQLLVRGGGVELNPGPICPFSGKVVKGDQLRNSKKLVCPQCSSLLRWGPKLRAGWGKHPTVVGDSEVSAFLLPPADDKGKQVVGGQKVELTKPRIDDAESKLLTVETAEPLDDEVAAAEEAAESGAKVSPPCDPAPKAGGGGGNGAKATLAAPPAALACLQGYVMNSDDSVEMMTRLGKECRMSRVLEPEDITVEVLDVPYVEERRLITSRGVTEVKAPFKLVQMHASVPTLIESNPLTTFLICLIPYVLFLGFHFYRPDIEYTLATYLSAVSVVGFWSSLVYKFWYRARAVAVEEVWLCYAPHLVSCLLMEFERGASHTVVASTIRMKLRRLAAFPIPDIDAVQICEGTERVVMLALEKQHFFYRRAMCAPLVH